jgi:peptidoglycan hydrolase-like protein with peptidoglycan-binding domain
LFENTSAAWRFRRKIASGGILYEKRLLGSKPTPRLQGDTGPDVTEIQNALRAKGFNPGPADGVFGPGTKAAVIAFQEANGLVVDGIVGPLTLNKLRS